MKGHPLIYTLLEQIKTLHEEKSASYTEGSDPLYNYKGDGDLIRPWDYSWKRTKEKLDRMKVKFKGKAKGSTIVDKELLEDALDMALQSLITYVLYLEDSGNENKGFKHTADNRFSDEAGETGL